ncbi:MAG TPA: helix-turn-helix domain-containing protein [Blastocatellia bacterium]|nr:helix-turn-helix domain-containing protein [Blastocatellia bacterium]
MTTKKAIEEKSELKSPIRMAAEDRRQQILEVAMQLFSQRGFRGTTTKEIALAAGVNEAIIYRHFATKSELYAAIMDNKAKSPPAQQMQILLHEAMEAGDDRRVFESLAFRILEFHDQDEMAMRILLYSALEGHELAEMIYRNHIAKTHRQLTEYVEKRIKQGIFRQMNAKTAVRCFIGMIINQVMFKKFF